MNSGTRFCLASKSGATALALSLLAGNAGAAPFCASPQEVTALRVAALRQELMVAALACHEAGSFNRFVTGYRDAFQDSDRILMSFFVRKGGGNGDDAYNAYKTRQANDASLRSLNDPSFCGEAAVMFRIALSQNPPLGALVSRGGPLVRTSYASCSRSDVETADATMAAPDLPARHRDLLGGARPAVTPTSAPLVAPSVPSAHRGIATVPPPANANPANSSPPPADERDARDAPPSPQDDRYADNTYSNAYDQSQPSNPQSYGAPNPYSSYAGSWYGYPAIPMRQVQGSDGRWYLMPAGGQ